MVCSSCKREFDNINELRFCPYCGDKLEESMDIDSEQTTEILTREEKKFDTLKIPVITDEDIKKYNRHKFFRNALAIFKKKRVIIPIATALLIAKPVDEGRIKQDLLGKVITLPKGTNIEIKKGYVKALSIKSRNTDKGKGKDEIKVEVTLNNGVIEVKTLLLLMYVNEGKNLWEFNNKITLAGDTVVKPVVSMDEKQFLESIKKLSVNIGDVPKLLNGVDVKGLGILKRTPDLQNSKEEVLVDVTIDNGLVASKGTVKCSLVFANEVWGIATIDRNSNEDFKLVLSPSFSEDKVVDIIKKEGLEETITHPDLFGGKGFNVRDSFTKSIKISDKKFDEQSGSLTVTAKRDNVSGEIKSTLATDYTFDLSLGKTTLLKRTKTTALTVAVDNMANELIISTIVNAEIEGANFLFWFADNHKITAEEAKTFKSTEILSKKGFQNVKYVYGSIRYMDGKKEKTTSVVALYFLVYDSAKGYNWKLDKVIGEDSPNYKTYSKASMNQ
jgi:hypothetical protein